MSSTVTKVLFQMEANSGNDAMVSDPCGEVSRMLREVATAIEGQVYSADGILRDSNGNKVGRWFWNVDRVDDE